jgi:hypothetical protein
MSDALAATFITVDGAGNIGANFSGTIEAGGVFTGTVLAGTIETGLTGARVVIDKEGLRAYNAAEAQVLTFDIATGNLSLRGEIQAGSTVPATTITGQLTNAQLKEIEAAKITGQITETQIGKESITTPKLAAGVVLAEKIATGAVVTEKLAAGAITTEKLAAGAVTAAKINVTELSAITANLGTVTAGTLKAVTIEGGTGTFTGLLTSTGINFELDPAEEFLTKNMVQWLVEGKTAKPAGQITTTSVNAKTISQIRLMANRNKEKEGGGVFLETTNKTGEHANLNLSSSTSGILQTFEIRLNKTSYTIMNSEGTSAFLQLASEGKLKLQLIPVIYTWKAGAGASEVLATKHSLNALPQFAYAVGLFGAGGAVHAMRITERTTTEIKTQVNRNEAVAVETKLEFLMAIVG